MRHQYFPIRLLTSHLCWRRTRAILSQRQADGKLHPIAFASRSLNIAEKNYCITDLETLAVVWSIAHFKTYLYGQKVTIYTDHAAVKAVLYTEPQHWWAPCEMVDTSPR